MSIAVFVAALLGGQTACADQPSPSVVVVRYLVTEQSPDRIDRLVTNPVERVLKAIPRVFQITSTTGHGYVNFEVEFEGDPSEEDLASLRQRLEELVFESEVVVTSRTILIKSPQL